MHNLLPDNQRELGVDKLKTYAAELGIDQFRASINDLLESAE